MGETPAEFRAPVVRIRPAWWSPRVWPLFLLALGLNGGFAWAVHVGKVDADDVPWAYLLYTWVFLVIAMRWPVVVIMRHRIEVSRWSAMDDSELLGLLSRPADWKRVVVLASEIREWRKEAPTIRLIVGGPPSRTVWFSIRGIRPADRERIVAWLTEKKGP